MRPRPELRPGAEPNDLAGGAFEELYRSEYPGLVRLAWLLTNGSHRGEDVVQLVFTRLYEHGSRHDIVNPRAWLWVAVINGCRDLHRRDARETVRLSLVAAGEPTVVAADHMMVLDAVARLPFNQRATLVMRYWLDLADDEIADLLQIRRGTVRTRTARAIEVLRKEIER